MSSGWKKDALAQRKSVVLRKSVGSVLLYHYYFSASFFKQNIRSWRQCIIVISNVPLEAAHKLWLNSESCPGALLWGRNHGTTANALQSPGLNYCQQIFTEYECHSKFSVSRSLGTTDKWDEIKATTAETNVSSTVCLTTSKDTGRVWKELL